MKELAGDAVAQKKKATLNVSDPTEWSENVATGDLEGESTFANWSADGGAKDDQGF